MIPNKVDILSIKKNISSKKRHNNCTSLHKESLKLPHFSHNNKRAGSQNDNLLFFFSINKKARLFHNSRAVPNNKITCLLQTEKIFCYFVCIKFILTDLSFVVQLIKSVEINTSDTSYLFSTL